MKALTDLFVVTIAIAAVLGCNRFSSNSEVASNSPNSDPRPANTARSTPVSESPIPTIEKKEEPKKPEKGRISFAKGETSAAVSDAVVRGEREIYKLGARRGQTMTVRITSLEDNAVFQIQAPNGKFLPDADEGDDATDWSGTLPADGDYKIIVGGTRGNATFRLTVSIE
jgi:hypothetical protein